MSKECLNVEQAKSKLNAMDYPSSREIVTKAQCLAMKALSEPLTKYTSDYECPADDDILQGDIDYIAGNLNLASGVISTQYGPSMGLIGCYSTMSGGSSHERLLGNFTITEQVGRAMGYVMCGICIVNDDHNQNFGNAYLRVYKGGGWPFANRVRIDIGPDPRSAYWFSRVFEFTDTEAEFDRGCTLIKPIGFNYRELLQFFEQLVRANYNAPYKFVFYVG